MTPTSNVSPAADRGAAPLALALVLPMVPPGCTSLSLSLPVVDTALGTPSADTSDGDNGVVSATVGGTGSSASETRPTDTADNLWEHAPVVIGVDTPADGCDYVSLVKSAVDYRWTNASVVAHDPAFVVRPNSSNPGVTVSVVGRIDDCGGDAGTDAVDYAPLLSGDDPITPTEPVTVVVTVGYDDKTTQMALRHEFGHLLGLAHGDVDVFPVLSGCVEMARLPEPDAGKRESPFHERTIVAHVDLSNVSFDERATHEAEIDHALSCYEGGAGDVVPVNLSFERVSNPEMADVTLSASAFRNGGPGVR